MEDRIILGSTIKCTAGRDKDKLFVVVSQIDSLYVAIADGKSRKVQRPKMKKIKHCTFHKIPDEDILNRLEECCLTNSVLRKHLAEYVKEE